MRVDISMKKRKILRLQKNIKQATVLSEKNKEVVSRKEGYK